MSIHAEANFKAGSWAAFEALIVPKLIKAVAAGTDAVFQESQILVPVREGDLKASGKQSVAWEDQKVTGTISYGEGLPDGRASYNEFGTGQRGAASGNAAPGITYNPEWPGMSGSPYIRPALDSKHLEIIRAFEDEGFKT